MRCREQFKTLPKVSRRLGAGWSSNGDFLTLAFYKDRQIDPTKGPTITCSIDYLDNSDPGGRYFIEDGGFPNLVGNAFADLAKTVGRIGKVYKLLAKHLSKSLDGSCLTENPMPWFGQGIDAADGKFYLERPQ